MNYSKRRPAGNPSAGAAQPKPVVSVTERPKIRPPIPVRPVTVAPAQFPASPSPPDISLQSQTQPPKRRPALVPTTTTTASPENFQTGTSCPKIQLEDGQNVNCYHSEIAQVIDCKEKPSPQGTKAQIRLVFPYN